MSAAAIISTLCGDANKNSRHRGCSRSYAAKWNTHCAGMHMQNISPGRELSTQHTPMQGGMGQGQQADDATLAAQGIIIDTPYDNSPGDMSRWAGLTQFPKQPPES